VLLEPEAILAVQQECVGSRGPQRRHQPFRVREQQSRDLYRAQANRCANADHEASEGSIAARGGRQQPTTKPASRIKKLMSPGFPMIAAHTSSVGGRESARSAVPGPTTLREN
jgi:hypothetical protein